MMQEEQGMEVPHVDADKSLDWQRKGRENNKYLHRHGSTDFINSSFPRLTVTRAASVNSQMMVEKDNYEEWTQRAKFPATYVKAVMAQIPVDERLMRGVRVTKVTTHGAFRPRVLTISKDRFALFVTHKNVKGGSSSGVLSTVAKTLPLPLISRKGIRGFTNSDVRDLYVRYLDICDIDFITLGYPCTRKLESSRLKNRLRKVEDRVDKVQDEIVSIAHHGGETLDVFISSAEERTLFVSTLKNLKEAYDNAKLYVDNEARLIRYIWYDVDKNSDGMVGSKEFALITNRINLGLANPEGTYRAFLKENKLPGPSLTYNECMELLFSIKEGKYTGARSSESPRDVPATRLWTSVFGVDKEYVTADEFLKKFLHKVQKETNATDADVKAILASINRMELSRMEDKLQVKPDCLSRGRFASYLHHAFNNAYDPDEQELNLQLMTRPITEYWINSSHNTYLMGDQLQSASSVEMYMMALHRGCKCLELDCWDGEKSKDGTPLPILFHGGTLTGKILFEDAILCVANYVQQHPDTYPIILSLENHCSKPFQLEMATIMKTILKDLLYTPFAEGAKDVLGETDLLPSPEMLRGRVLVKGKRPHTNNTRDINATASAATTFDEEDEDEDKYEALYMETGKRVGIKGNVDAKRAKQNKAKEKAPLPSHSHGSTVMELAELTLFHGCKFKKWDQSIDMPPSHMHSIGETKIYKLLTKGGASAWREYNETHMTRTYPAGTRVDSSNYNPIVAWSTGSQMVALNFQTPDAALILNDGRFRQNGSCGYVLKPPSLRPVSPPMKLKVRIVSGSCLPKPMGAKKGEDIDPYIGVTLHDVVPNKEGTESYKASSNFSPTVDNNGFCPVWQEDASHEFAIHSPHVAMIQFSLLEADIGLDDKVSDSAIPITCLRKGYRSVLMHDMNGTRSGVFGFATLLVEIDY